MPEAAQPQEIIRPPTEAAIFLVAEVVHGGEQDVRDLLGDLGGLTRAVGFRAPAAALGCVAGLGAQLWDRLTAATRPAGLHDFLEIRGPRHTAVATGGDLLFHIRAARPDLCFELAQQIVRRLPPGSPVLEEVHGFKYFDERDLLGFVDGTENPVGADASEAVTIGDEDPGFAGGSYVIVQRYLHDLGAWERLAVREQELIVGRSKLEDIELSDEEQPARSHVALNTIVDDQGEEHDIVRFNMPFGNVGEGEFGTYFIGYSRDVAITEQMLQNMFLGEPAGEYDRILDFSTATSGALFFVPSADMLEQLPEAGASAAPAAEVGAETCDAAAEGSLGLGAMREHSQSPPGLATIDQQGATMSQPSHHES